MEGFSDVSICDLVSINQTDILKDWNVYINYVSQQLVVDVKGSPSAIIEIYNPVGIKIISEKIDGGGERSVSVSHLDKGVYFVRLTAESGVSQVYTILK